MAGWTRKKAMKVSSRKGQTRPTEKRGAAAPLIVDEYQYLIGQEPLKSMHLNYLRPRLGAAKYVVTQAVARGKRGKVVMIGMTRDAVTGEPFPAPPQKFLPAQVVRRQSSR